MLKAKLLGATAGAEAALPIEDVFSTHLYTGNGSTQTITNGIDLAGEGGLVWLKSRSLAEAHQLFDTERGIYNRIFSNSTAAQSTSTNTLTAFNSDGFSIGDNNISNTSGSTNVSWTFRKAPRFFDVVTYTGNGTAGRQIAHNLGTTVGTIIVKKTNDVGDWGVFHRSITGTGAVYLDKTSSTITSDAFWNNTNPTDTVFTVGSSNVVNASGSTYVAYLFAHDPLGPSGDGSDGLIACGSYTGTATVDLGWEPQFILMRPATASGYNWYIYDTMRGWPVGSVGRGLYPNSSSAEDDYYNAFDITPTGFKVKEAATAFGGASDTYIYIAIRRGPMREPTSGTEVFNVVTQTASAGTSANVGFPVDTSICTYRTAYNTNYMGVVQDRLRGYATANTSGTYPALVTNSTQTETALSPGNPVIYGVNNSQTSISFGTNAATGSTVVWNFRRAPGFFDVVAYTGTGANRTVPHNLGVAPEFIIVKQRASGGTNWRCYHSANGATNGIALNLDLQSFASTLYWNDTSPTSSVFTVGTSTQVNASGGTYIAYLFATLAGISKVGSYTGNGSNQTINCGFTTGARFILIKRTDSTGDWYVWDTARGIVTGNDPFLELNTTDAEVTSDDSIDPDSSGFIVNQTATTNVNVSSATYIFMAIS
jgi:hypothetical protein